MSTVTVMPGSQNVKCRTLELNDSPAHVGGEGSVYYSSDGCYVVKLYHRTQDRTQKQQLLQTVVDLGRKLGEDEQFLAWPLAVVDSWKGQESVGVVTRRVPNTHKPLYKVIYSPRDAVEQFRKGYSWVDYLKIARGAVGAVRAIHGMGMAHADIHLKNFLADPGSGDVVLVDLDGLVVKGFLSPQVKGMRGFIAPEVEMGTASPSLETDRHSVAILVLWTLLFRNVLLPRKCYDPDHPEHDDALGYGKYACFSENPNDQRNWLPNIGTPLFRQGALSYKTLTRKLQELTERALIQGLHNPRERPQAVEWERALAEAYDQLTHCRKCRQSFCYPYWVDPPGRRRCPFCGETLTGPLPAVLELMEERARGNYVPVRTVVVYNGLPLFADIIEPGQLPPFTRRGAPVAGMTAWDPARKVYRLQNQCDMPWQVIAGSGGRVERGQSVALERGTVLSFGARKRLVRVLE